MSRLCNNTTSFLIIIGFLAICAILILCAKWAKSDGLILSTGVVDDRLDDAQDETLDDALDETLDDALDETLDDVLDAFDDARDDTFDDTLDDILDDIFDGLLRMDILGTVFFMTIFVGVMFSIFFRAQYVILGGVECFGFLGVTLAGEGYVEGWLVQSFGLLGVIAVGEGVGSVCLPCLYRQSSRTHLPFKKSRHNVRV